VGAAGGYVTGLTGTDSAPVVSAWYPDQD
jgi:hypothetical protein